MLHESSEASGVTVGQADLLHVALEPLDKRDQGGLLPIGGEVGIGSGTHCSGECAREHWIAMRPCSEQEVLPC